MTFALILAGGVGSRMNSSVPKQFLEIGKKPVLIHTLDVFNKVSEVNELVVVVSLDYLSYTKKLINDYYKGEFNISVISGGSSRENSVLNGLNYLKQVHNLQKSDIVITHDSVRPFVTSEIILDNIKETRKTGAATTAVKTVDTIMSSDGECVTNVLKRESLYNVQTPQTFRVLELLDLLEHNKEVITELSSLYVLNNKKVSLVNGSYNNFKITTIEDLERANNLLVG